MPQGAEKLQAVKHFSFFKKLYFSFYVSNFHMKTAPSMNTYDFSGPWFPLIESEKTQKCS